MVATACPSTEKRGESEMTTLPWINAGMAYEGTREVKGSQHNPVIVNWLVKLGAWWTDDETPWCGVFAAAVFREVGIQPPSGWYRAKSWLQWGKPLSAPVIGCVVVFSRPGGYHVGIVIGQDRTGNLLVLGGNQGDSVKVSAFRRDRVEGYRWPTGYPVACALPVLSSAEFSQGEA